MLAQVTSFSMEVKNKQMTQKTIKSRTDLSSVVCVFASVNMLWTKYTQVNHSLTFTTHSVSFFSCTQRKEQDQRKRSARQIERLHRSNNNQCRVCPEIKMILDLVKIPFGPLRTKG